MARFSKKPKIVSFFKSNLSAMGRRQFQDATQD